MEWLFVQSHMLNLIYYSYRDNLQVRNIEYHRKHGVTMCCLILQEYSTLKAKLMFSVSEEFKSFDELSKRLVEFENKSYVQLYTKWSRSIQSAAKCTTKKRFNDALKYSEIDYACIHGGRMSRYLPQYQKYSGVGHDYTMYGY